MAVFTTCGEDYKPCQLWRTDGTEPGTFPIATLHERYLDDASTPTYYPVVVPSTASDGRFVVFAGGGAWSSDGTVGGTQRLALGGGADGRRPLKQKLGDVWIFTGGYHLWRSDGTPEGTRSLAYFSGGRVDLLGGTNEVAVFAVEPEGGGTELWRSDGTEAGTFAVSSMPALGRWAWDEEDQPGRATVGNTVFFSGCPPDLGCQLWAVTISSPSTTTTSTTTSTTTTTTIPVCGDGVTNKPSEECDTLDDAACPGACRPSCTCGTALLLGTIEADASVREKEPDQNFGTDTELSIDADTPKQTFLRVQVNGLGAKTLVGATLRLQVADDTSAQSDSGGRIHTMTDCGWDELTITWNTNSVESRSDRGGEVREDKQRMPTRLTPFPNAFQHCSE